MTNSGKVIQALILEGRDNQVLKMLYGSIFPKVKQYLLKNGGSKEEAEDLFQDSVLVIYSKATEKKLDTVENVGGFMMQTVKNLWLNRLRKIDRMHNLNDRHDDISDSYNLLETLNDSEKNSTIQWMLDQIGEKCKELLLLSVFQKLSMEEITVKMGFTSANAAKTNNYRCKEKLIQLVEKNPEVKTLLKE